jgi:excisionase family DNA binding protein
MQESSTAGRLLLTIPEAAVALGIGRTLAYGLVLSGDLPSIKLGRARRVPVAGLAAYLERKMATGSDDESHVGAKAPR